MFGIAGAPRALRYGCDACPGLKVEANATAGGTRAVNDTTAEVPDSDLTWFYDGYIMIVPIAGNYTAPGFDAYAKRLGATYQ
ncbi:MAG: hypothetical protein QF921_14175 [Pseudomonadales bacterium]|jgi:hypothetical protein|nr:hypothetical protein [Pseudomonadales bacterium]MDP6829231.1 hypothetical protein [Pseudomonadales bacterium]MDP6972628.1 hypothetical protein [Pseudomonadales bacterium]